MDLSKCFDRLDHNLILESVNRKVSDGSVLKLIKSFLKAGVMTDGLFEDTEIGSPQGGVISPLLTNIYLDHFDQEMMRRKIRIVRYADDILILARNGKRAEKYLSIAVKILEDDLKLVVNREKTHLTDVHQGVPYLGFVIYSNRVTINLKKVKSFRKRVRELTPRNHGMNVREMIKRLNPVLRGWGNYFRIANCKGIFEKLMEWIRRRLRMKKMREWKSWEGLHKALRRIGHKGEFLKISMVRWRNSCSPPVHKALPNKWFDELKLVNLSKIKTGILHQFSESGASKSS
jgi:RNA-directed DNA polymerase